MGTGPQPGWYAISVNYLHPVGAAATTDGEGKWKILDGDCYGYFRRFRPVATAGYSIYVYHIEWADANRVRRELGLPELPVIDESPHKTKAGRKNE